MDESTANSEVRRNLEEVKRAAELLLNLMDLIMGRIKFELGEVEKFTTLRQAILDFRSVEINPGVQQNIVIDPDNMENLEKLYGAITDQRKNALINSMIRDCTLRAKQKIKPEDFEAKHQQQKSKLKKALDMIESKEIKSIV